MQIENGNIANQIHGFTIDYGKFILNTSIPSTVSTLVKFALGYSNFAEFP